MPLAGGLISRKFKNVADRANNLRGGGSAEIIVARMFPMPNDKMDLVDREPRLRNLFIVGAIASVLQLLIILVYMILTAMLGPRIVSAAEFFALQQTNLPMSLLRVDFPMLILVGLYLGNFPALLVALWRVNPVPVLFAALFTGIAVILGFAGESTFALLRLGDLYATAATQAQRAQLLAAGEAVLAAGWWHSSGSYMAGILLQGGGVLMSLVMWRSNDFSKVTAGSGFLGNAFDLAQHLCHPFAPDISAFLAMFMVFYFAWYPMLARDLFRLGKSKVK